VPEDLGQEPTPSAEIDVQLGPSSAEIEFQLGPISRGKAVLRGVETADMLTVGGSVVTACVGIAVAVQTSKVASVAFAELAVALIVSLSLLGYGFARAKLARMSLSELTRQAELIRQVRQAELDKAKAQRPDVRGWRRKKKLL